MSKDTLRTVLARPQLAVVDAHCHIDLYENPAAVAHEAESLGIHTIAVTNAPSVFHFTKNLTDGLEYVRPAAGLHPELVQTHGRELPQLLSLLEQTQYVGEIGLDYVTNDPALRKRQRDVFTSVVEKCSILGNKVLTIHSRRAVDDVLAIIGNDFPGRAILHWFSGTAKQVEAAVAAGLFFSVNTPMFNSKGGQKLLCAMPTDHVLTETDGPFVKVGDRPPVPADTGSVVEGLAKLWKMEPRHASSKISATWKALLTPSQA